MTPAALVSIDEQNPWPGLSAFDEASKQFFNGRRQESTELRRLIGNAPLTVLFGASGLGKTSLIQAGAFPLLRSDHYLPIYVRLDVRERSAPLIDQATAALKAEMQARRVDAPALAPDESLWQYLHRSELELWSEQNHLLVPVFVLDQFEEVFTLGAENAAAIARLRIDLADLIENRLPTALAAHIQQSEVEDNLSLNRQHYRIVLSFREDYLAAVEEWKNDSPSLLRNRLRVLPMSGEQAFEAVHVTAPHLANEAMADKIVRFVAAARQTGAADPESAKENLDQLVIEPALLSLVCRELNERRKTAKKSTFDEGLLQGSGSAIISTYYHNSVQDLPDRVQRFIEKELITERGFRRPFDVGDAYTLHQITESDLRLLVNRRLLRIVPQRGTEQVELTHDLLTRAVREHRDKQRELDRKRRQRKVGISMGAAGLVLAGLVFLFAQLYRNAEAQRRRADELLTALREARKSSPRLQSAPMRPLPVSTSPPPPPMATPTVAPASPKPYFTASELARLYNFPEEFDGRGQTIGLITFGGGYSEADLTAYFGELKLPVPTVTSFSVDGASNRPGTDADFEVTLQIEITGAAAPGSRLVVYFAPNTNQGFVDAVTAAIHDKKNQPSVLGISWGSPEQSWTPQASQALNNALQQAGPMGITVIAAAGDSGVTDGLHGIKAVDFPAASPYVLAVGGTRLSTNNGAIVSEVAWNDSATSGGATGGGFSNIFALPAWQSSLKLPSLGDQHPGRGLPDVAASASPARGYYTLVHGTKSILGGTAAAVPLWTGLIARINQGLGRNVGYLNPLLYKTLGPAKVLRDVTQGNNGIDNIGGYYAARGWDACTGWGTPDGRKLLEALKAQVRKY